MDERSKQLLALGREHYDKREFDRAEHYFREVLSRGGAFADVHNMLGVIHHDRGRFTEAQAAFEEALAINPYYTEAALNLAVTYNDLGRYEEAKKIYRAALRRGDEENAGVGSLDPFVKGKIANLHADVAQAYADAGLVEEAKDELSKAVSLCPDFADLRLRLANLHRQSGDFAAARDELEEAVKARPAFIPARLAYGLVHLALGNPHAALAEWREVMRVDPENRAARMYAAMLDRGETPAGVGMLVGAPSAPVLEAELDPD